MSVQTFFNPLGTNKGAPYPVGTVLFESGTAGTYSVNVYEGIYELQICGAGGGGGGSAGSHAWYGQNGGTGAAWKGQIKLSYGTYTLNIGQGGNGGAGTGNYSGANNGAGGTLTIGSLNIINTSISSNGITQSTTSILGNGYGAGGAIRGGTSGLNGTNGYIKLSYIRLRPN